MRSRSTSTRGASRCHSTRRRSPSAWTPTRRRRAPRITWRWRSRSTPSSSAAPPRAQSRAEPRRALLAEELLQQRVEGGRPLEHRHVSGVLEDHLARAGDQLLEHVGVADGDEPIAIAPYDQGGAGYLGQSLAHVV